MNSHRCEVSADPFRDSFVLPEWPCGARLSALFSLGNNVAVSGDGGDIRDVILCTRLN